MILNLTDISSEPLYGQIVRQVRAQILSGVIHPEMALPSIRDLARDYKISVITVQRAYDDLAREGFLVVRKGKGFFARLLRGDEKTSIAADRCRRALEPILTHALDEGLEPATVSAIVQELLSNRRNVK